MTRPTLITIPFSHYCEKARWALEAAGVDYVEEGHAPLAHVPATRRVGGKTVPVLVDVDGRIVLHDSTDIVLYADRLAAPARRLLPAPGDPARAEVLALEAELDETLGIDARLLAYWHNLKDAGPARKLVGRLLGVRSAPVAAVVAPLFRALVFRAYRVDETSALRSETRVRSAFARLSTRLEAGEYLFGSRFTLADLTLAALAAPLLAPVEHPVTGSSRGSFTPALAALRSELSASRAGQHALRMYREHRKPSVAPEAS